jgi:predicted alpha/beta hydrolase
MFTIEKIEIKCIDGVVLRGLLLVPEKPKAVLQFNCGTATKKEFYLPFLEYLSDNNYICCLWDYRGCGDSADTEMKFCSYTFSDYGLKDIPAVKTYLTNRFPALPFFFFGHSAGGQLIGFVDELQDVSGMVCFAVSTGYLPYMPLGYRIKSYYFFYLFTPISLFFMGYLKAKKIGIMEDLPKNVVLEWRNWCAKKNYFFDSSFYGKTVPHGNFKDFTFPIHVFSTLDDTISSPKNIANFWNHIKSEKPITFESMHPKKFGLKSIGHFGMFKKKHKDHLWKKALEKLDEQLNFAN